MMRRIVIAGIVGFLLGRGADALRNKPARESVASVMEPSAALRSGMRELERRIEALTDVQACRDLFAAAEIPDGRHPLLRRLDRERALRRWLEIDPASALAEAERDPAGGIGPDLFRAWVELDPAGALEAFNQSSRGLAGKVAKDFFVALMALDPVLAAEELKSDRWKKETEDFLGWGFHDGVIRQWVLSDLSAAIASLGPPSAGRDWNQQETMILKEWAATDFDAAWAHCFPVLDPEKDLLSSAGAGMLAKGLLGGSAAALELLGAVPESREILPGYVQDYRSDIADQMVRADPQAAMDWALKRPEDDPLRLAILARAAGKLASSDPEAALAMLNESGGSSDKWENDSVLRESFAALAAVDPEAAAARVMTLPEEQRMEAMGGYLTRVFASDPEAALAQCRAWLADPDLAKDLPAAWAKSFSWGHGSGIRDPGPMLEAIPELNSAVDSYVLSTWTKADPEAAAGWIATRLEQGEKVPLDDKGVLADLSTSLPEFTASWLLTLPDAEVQAKAAGTLVANWAAFDPAAARGWIDSLPPGPLRESADKGLTETSPGKDPFDPFR